MILCFYFFIINYNIHFKYFIIGGDDYAEAATFFAKRFLKLNANKNRTVSTHLTWATDTRHCSTIVKLTIQSLQQYALNKAGLT